MKNKNPHNLDLPDLPGSDDASFWGAANIQQADEIETEPVTGLYFRRSGQYAIAAGVPFEYAIRVDWERFTIKNGAIVPKP